MTALKVLIVEDSENDTLLVVNQLELAGYDVDFIRVETLEAMNTAIQGRSWDLIISDHSMPEFDSCEALQVVKEHTLDIPFIVVSGAIGEEAAVLAMKSGVHDYVMKGNLTRLVPAIERELGEADVRRQIKESDRKLKRATRALKALSDCSQALLRASDEAYLLNEVCHISVEVGGYFAAWIGFAQHDKNKSVRPVAQYGLGEAVLETFAVTWGDDDRGSGPTGMAIKRNQVRLVRDISTDGSTTALREQIPSLAHASVISLPLVVEERAIGAITIIAKDPAAFDEEEAKLLTELADNLSYGITTIRLRAEQERAREALRESEHMLRTILSTSPIGIGLTRDRRIGWANEAWREMFGFEGELDYLDRNTRFLYASEQDYERAGMSLYPGLETGKVCETETMFRRKDGSVFHAHVKVKALDPLDPAKGVISAISDISSRIRAEEVQRRLATAVEQAAEAVVMTDADGVIQYVNPATERITGFDKSEIIGKTSRIFKSGEHDRAFYEKLWNTIIAGNVWNGRITNKKKDGSLYHEDATISPIKDTSGKVVNFVAVKRDVTENLQLAKQLFQAQKMEAIGTLAGGVAHDFNNILTVVAGYSELLLTETDKQDPLYADIQKIHQAGQKGADLVKRLLAFSKNVETKAGPLSLNHQIRQLQEMLTRTIPKMIGIELKLADDLSRVNADPTQIDQILMNLAVNAKDAMPDGGNLTIETSNVVLDEEFVRAHLGAGPGEYVLLRVSDTGHGMDKEMVTHIFEPFFTTKEAGRGTGLGLAMVYGIVKQHNGYITCNSEPEHGATFQIYLPAAVAEANQSEKAVREVLPGGGTETILLVDDEEYVRDLGTRILKGSGYTTLTASDGKDALELYRKEKDRISLVILDLIMPEMGGKQCLEELLTIDPQIRVLIASGFVGNEQTKRAIDRGARGFVGKPYNIKAMLQAVRDVLDADQ